MPVNVRAAIAAGSQSLPYLAASFPLRTGLWATPRIHKMSTGENTFRCRLFVYVPVEKWCHVLHPSAVLKVLKVLSGVVCKFFKREKERNATRKTFNTFLQNLFLLVQNRVKIRCENWNWNCSWPYFFNINCWVKIDCIPLLKYFSLVFNPFCTNPSRCRLSVCPSLESRPAVAFAQRPR